MSQQELAGVSGKQLNVLLNGGDVEHGSTCNRNAVVANELHVFWHANTHLGVTMALDYQATAKSICDAVGGPANIADASHCQTRLRLILADESKASDEVVGAIKGVKGVIRQCGQYQIVIGNEVSDLFKEFKKLGNWGEGAAPVQTAQQGNAVQRLFGFISGCLTPLLPAMLGTGMVKVLLTLLTTAGVIDASSPTYQIFFGMADSFFYFLPIMLGWSIAKKTGHSVPLYLVIGAALVYPDLINLLGGAAEGVEYGTFLGQNCTYLFGVIPVVCASYSSSVLPMLLMTPVMGWAEDFADLVSPNVLKAFLKPMIFFLICTPVVFCVLGPLGAIIGNQLAGAIAAAYEAVPWLTVGVLSAAMPFIVMTGMHYALIPLSINSFATLGYEVMHIVTMYCSNICQGAASLGVAAKTKDVETKSEGIACGISALVAGITEPAMYGINMRFVKPMIASVIGAGIGGLIAGISGVKAFSMGGSPSLFSLITFIGGESNALHGLIWGIISGAIGVAIRPSEGNVYAPCDAVVTMLADTRHAIGLTSDTGAEILIHIGLDTVELQGKPFTYNVAAGQKVKQGDLLMTVDLDAIKIAGRDIVSPVIITNTDAYAGVRSATRKATKVGEKILTLS